MNRGNRPRLSRVTGSTYSSKLFRPAGDGSTLSLDFTTGVLDSRLTFTRSSTTATYIDGNKFVASASTNIPRFDCSPSTGAVRGLLIETSATNLLNWSETFATSGGVQNWNTPENATLGTLTTSPRNATDAYPINETTTNGVHRLRTYSLTGLSGAYSLSVWAKCVDSNTPRRLYINANTALGAGALFDLTATGTSGNAVNVSGTAGNRAGTWVAYPNGWYRCTLIGTRAADGTIYLQINRSTSTTASDDSFAGSTSNGIIMWGAQLESGSAASSYIPTTASTGTRNQDLCYMSGTGFLSWFGSSSASAGTLLASWDGLAASSGRFATINDNSYTNQIWVGQAESAIYIASGPGFVVTFGGATTNGGKVAIAYDTNTSNTVRPLNGSVGAGQTASSLPTSLSRLDIGNSQAGTANVNCWLKSIKFWPTRLPNTTLQSITT